MTHKQLKALKRHKEHVRRRNIRTNNIPRGTLAEALWYVKFEKLYNM